MGEIALDDASDGKSEDEGASEEDEVDFGTGKAGSSIWVTSRVLANCDVAAVVFNSPTTATGPNFDDEACVSGSRALLVPATFFLLVCSSTVLATAFRGMQDCEDPGAT